GMIFAVRGIETTFDNLRALGWYDAIPQLGAILFAAGWWSGHPTSTHPSALASPRFRDLLAVLAFAAVVLALQTPRAQRVIFQYDGLSAPAQSDDRSGSGPLRTPSELAQQARSQRSALAQLDQLERTAPRRGQELTAWLDALHGISVPGMPETLTGIRVLDLL